MPDVADCKASRTACIDDILTSTRTSEEINPDLAAINAMDVLLDACWAVVSEIEMMDGPLPDSLNSFADKRTHHISSQ